MTTPENADLSWNENAQPISTLFDDVYFSTASGLDESRYVFIKHNNLIERWQQLKNDEIFTIFEAGFGTGLNFLATWQAWQEHAPANSHLHFISVEKYPLTKTDLIQSQQLWPNLAQLSEKLCNLYHPHANGFYRLNLNSQVSLTLILDDVITAVNSLLTIPNAGPNVSSTQTNWSGYENTYPGIDAWFLDGFTPAKNPQMWSSDFFNICAKLSHKKSTFATFTAASAVRNGLLDAGFEVIKYKGFGRKREMLAGVFTGQKKLPAETEGKNKRLRYKKPSSSWHLQNIHSQKPKSVAIIGGGLAGTHTAFQLAGAGLDVTLIEQHSIGSGGSGNAQGALYTKLSNTTGVLADFNLASYLYACAFYQNHALFSSAGQQCGLLQLAQTPEIEYQYQQIAQRYPNLVQLLTPEDCSKLAGVNLTHKALHFSQSGWLNPTKVCIELLKHPRIKVLTNQAITSLELTSAGWVLFDQTQSTQRQKIVRADAVVLACAEQAKLFDQCLHLPTKPIRGQVTNAPTNSEAQALQTVLCAEGYIAPQASGAHCLGATFTLKNQSPKPNNHDNEINLKNIRAISKAFTKLQPAKHGGERVSFRCTTPDYLPVVGPVAKETQMLERFAKYRQNSKYTIDQPGEYWPGLFINVGHGSRGLTYTPLCAQIVANMITNSPLPVSQALMLKIHSARFLMRDLARNRL